MVKRVSILGVTGSIGMNTVAMLKHLGGREAFQTVAVTGGANIAELAVCARDLGAEIAVTAYEDRLEDLQAALAGSGVIAAAGEQALLELLLRCRWPVTGRGPFGEEFVTAGGIELGDVNLSSMESRLVGGLYFAGELLDIDGVTGGFNFQHCWSSGWIAGQAIAQGLT